MRRAEVADRINSMRALTDLSVALGVVKRRRGDILTPRGTETAYKKIRPYKRKHEVDGFRQLSYCTCRSVSLGHLASERARALYTI